MKPSETLALFRDELKTLAAERGLPDVRVFGSTARGEDREDSDLDLLICVDDASNFFPAISFIVEVQRRYPSAHIDAITDVMARPDVLRAAILDGIPL